MQKPVHAIFGVLKSGKCRIKIRILLSLDEKGICYSRRNIFRGVVDYRS
jgi:hypothetical protein